MVKALEEVLSEEEHHSRRTITSPLAEEEEDHLLARIDSEVLMDPLDQKDASCVKQITLLTSSLTRFQIAGS